MSAKKTILLSMIIFLIGQMSLFAQTSRITLSGTIVDTKTGETLPNVVVNIKELNLWTAADVNGNFSFKNVVPGIYSIQTSCLGYKDYEMKMELTRDVLNYKLRLEEQSLALKEVVVTATDARKMNSSSNISKAALDHLQVTNLADAMQLLPGSLTSNPKLTELAQISVRDIMKDQNSAIGTAIIVDGARMSNDANMQMITTAKVSGSGSFGTVSSTSAAGKGLDARQISVDNIESIEVIRGVASAEYGDLTSGAVVVKTKAGKSPFEVRFKTDPNIKQVYASKGIELGGKGGFLNIDADYTNAMSDIRKPSLAFDKGTFVLKYSNTFNQGNRPFRFNAKVDGRIMINNKEKDPDETVDEIFESKDNSIGANIYGGWMVNKPWLTQLTYDVSGSYGQQYNREKVWHSTSKLPSTNSMESGEHVGTLLNYQYFSDLEIEGRPVYASSKLMAKISGKYGSIYNNFTLGAQWSTKGNQGDGKKFDPLNPPTQSIRPRSFKDIPFVNEYTGFAEDKITLPIKSSSLDLSAGIRVTNISTPAANYDPAIDPRFNARLKIVDKGFEKSGLQYLSIRGGWGIQHKMPLLLHLYPDPSYSDKNNLTYSNDNTGESLVIITTKVSDGTNPNLKLQRSRNMEFGVDFKLFGISANIAYFNEKMKNGYNLEGTGEPFAYRQYNFDQNMGVPEYINGEVYVNGQPISYQLQEGFTTYNRPGNGITSEKWGIEYSLDFGKIDAIKTSILVDGAYFNQKRLDEGIQADGFSQTVAGKPYPYLGIYVGNGSAEIGRVQERLNTNIRLVTHIPQLRLIFTITGQCVWIDSRQRLNEYKDKTLVYMKDSDGNIVEGDPYKDSKYMKYVNPIAYMDTQGEIHPFTAEDAKDPKFKQLLIEEKPLYFNKTKQDPYFMLNFQLTKEIGKIASLSFYANNFTNSKPRRLDSTTGLYSRMNTDICFGAELSLKF